LLPFKKNSCMLPLCVAPLPKVNLGFLVLHVCQGKNVFTCTKIPCVSAKNKFLDIWMTPHMNTREQN